MAEAFTKNIIFPNKQSASEETFYNGHLMESETYIGGRVECMHNGVYRCDLDTEFVLDQAAFEELVAKTPSITNFFVVHELGKNVDDVINFEQVNSQIISKLSRFACLEKPKLVSKPLIYHVDVAAMYPNIILTNRLQPVSIVSEKTCSGCVYNSRENNCKRFMDWQWKGDYYPLNRGEFERIKLQHVSNPLLTKPEDNLLLRKAVREYSQKHYKQAFEHKTEMRRDIVCMRENPFYVDTVRAFRDRRYEFKTKVKVWAKALQRAKDDPDESKRAHNMMLLYESLQLAHKSILNSFYGYVMRRGARWYSMEMAAMVTHTGSEIIQHARNLFVKIGKPLELDTDGIWTLLPAGFPETFDLEFRDGSKGTISFPCSMCNLLIYDSFKNSQYQMERPDKPMKFTTTSEMSIFFEIDGPHRAMVIPAAREENKVLKKRYAVFDMKGKLSEVKGFEIKRRGELKIIKIFQGEIFGQYLKGDSLQDCYRHCAETCNKWLGILVEKGKGMRDSDIVDLIAESKVLAKNIKDYNSKKGVAITAAKRMSEFLGQDLLEGKGLNCKFIVSRQPTTAPLNERAIPVAIFEIGEEAIRMKLLRKWLKDPKLESSEIKPMLDWDYYIERLSNTIQKMVTLSAAYQGIPNPVPKVAHPKWLEQKLARESSTNPQTKLQEFFLLKSAVRDIEDAFEADIARPKRMDVEHPKSSKSSAKKDLDFTPTKLMDQDFKGWLHEQKKLWRLNRDRRKVGILTPATHRRDNELTSLFKLSETYLLTSELHLVGVGRSGTPGEYLMWVAAENGLVSFKMKIDRTIYIHCYNSKISVPSEFRKTGKLLPRDKKNHALFEYSMPEAAFLANKSLFERYLLNPEYEGIYETQMDLLFKLILKAGAKMRLGQGCRKDEQGCYHFKDIVHFNSGPANKLDRSKFASLYFYCVPFKDEKAVLVINEKSLKTQLIFFHKRRFNETSQLKKIILNSIVRSGRKEEYSLEVLQEKNDRETIRSTLAKLQRSAEEAIAKNFVCYVYGYSHLKAFFDELSESHPVCVISAANYASYLQAASSLDWHVKAIEHIGEMLMKTDDLIDDKLEISRVLNIPFCNLPEQWETFATDVMYARLLNKHNMVHWCSSQGSPDLGMGEVVSEGLVNLIENQQAAEEEGKLIFCPNYSLEIGLENLELNAILKYEDLMKADREVAMLVEGG